MPSGGYRGAAGADAGICVRGAFGISATVPLCYNDYEHLLLYPPLIPFLAPSPPCLHFSLSSYLSFLPLRISALLTS